MVSGGGRYVGGSIPGRGGPRRRSGGRRGRRFAGVALAAGSQRRTGGAARSRPGRRAGGGGREGSGEAAGGAPAPGVAAGRDGGG